MENGGTEWGTGNKDEKRKRRMGNEEQNGKLAGVCNGNPYPKFFNGGYHLCTRFR